ncbi:MAG: hypothetical protein IK088_09750 [Lachnospiraceae bacterium]|nr:hypothetical protein [Lachnospiraceae bacterium]
MSANAFTVSLAGTTILVRPFSEKLEPFLAGYVVTDDNPRYTVEIREEDVLEEPEYLALHRKLAEILIREDVLLVHASVIAIDGFGYAFLGRSGTGKSTHARLIRETFGSRTFMVNDDKPFFKVTGEGVFAYGSPWSGKHHLETNTYVPIRGMCFLHQAEDNSIKPLTGFDYFRSFFPQIYRQNDGANEGRTLELAETIVKTVPGYTMNCNMEPDAARLSVSTMHRFSIEDLLNRDGEVTYTTVGTSMMPMLREGKDIVVIQKRGDREIRPLDVVLFIRDGDEKHYVLHRVKKVNGRFFDIVGDNQTFVEKNVEERQIIGVLTAFIRDGKEIPVTDPEYLSYAEKIMKSLPWRQFKAFFRTLPGRVKRKLRKLFGLE